MWDCAMTCWAAPVMRSNGDHKNNGGASTTLYERAEETLFKRAAHWGLGRKNNEGEKGMKLL